MKNYPFYIAFLCLATWAGNRVYTQNPPPSSVPAIKSDSSTVIKLQEQPATVQTTTYIHPQ
jgi:hypothetical protein